MRALVDDILLVTEQQIEQALSLLITIEKTVTEGAGAAGLAVLANEARFKGRAVGLVLSGGNIDTRLLSSVLTRQLAREGRLTRFRFDIADPLVFAGVDASPISNKSILIVPRPHKRPSSRRKSG